MLKIIVYCANTAKQCCLNETYCRWVKLSLCLLSLQHYYQNKLKLAIIGQSLFGQEVYSNLRKQGHKVVGVFTVPDKDGKADPLGEFIPFSLTCWFTLSLWFVHSQTLPGALLSWYCWRVIMYLCIHNVCWFDLWSCLLLQFASVGVTRSSKSKPPSFCKKGVLSKVTAGNNIKIQLLWV